MTRKEFIELLQNQGDDNTEMRFCGPVYKKSGHWDVDFDCKVPEVYCGGHPNDERIYIKGNPNVGG